MYKPNGNYCSICNIHDKWCEHLQPPKSTLDETKLNDAQRDELSRRFGNKIQTVELTLRISFNNLGFTDQPAVPLDRVADGVLKSFGFLWHVPATGANTHIPHKDHKSDCATHTHPAGAFALCTCGAYGEEGPPNNFWSLLSTFTEVKAVGVKIETIEKGKE